MIAPPPWPRQSVRCFSRPGAAPSSLEPAWSESVAATRGIGLLLTLQLCTSERFGVERAARRPPSGTFKDVTLWAVWLGAVRVSSRCNQAIQSGERVRRQCDFHDSAALVVKAGDRAGVDQRGSPSRGASG